MEIWQLLTAPENSFFSICLIVCCAITALEVISFVIGGANEWLDGLLPESLKVDFDTPSDAGFLIAVSSWLYLGRVSLLIWLMVFFGGWGTVGILLQSLSVTFIGFISSALVMVPTAFIVNLFVVHFVCGVLNRILPKDETYVVAIKELIGLEAEIVIGVSKPNFPAQAKVKDQYDIWHYLMVEPLNDEEFHEGEKVVLYEYLEGNSFKVVSPEKFNLEFNLNN